MRRAAALLACLGLAACGTGGAGGGPHRRPAGAAAVIRGWVDALRRGDVRAASPYFALPAVVANGTAPVTLRSRRQVEAFNRTLPCGARLIAAVPHHGWVLAEFVLTDRGGPGAIVPCDGRGAKAATAFRIAGGKIREWLRVPAPGVAPAPAGTPA